MDDLVNVGLVGCGGMGLGLADAVRDSGRGRMVGFCDEIEERSKQPAQEHGGRAYGSIDEMLGEKDLDAVMIAAPQFFREEPTEAAARAGKHVYVEKPMALSVAGCDRMIHTCREAGVTLMVGQVLRYYEPFRSILRWSREGRFGRPLHACIQRVCQGSFEASSWRCYLSKSGGCLFELGIHELDFMRCLLGRPRRVFALRQKARQAEHELEDTMSMLVQFESGASGHYDSGMAWGKDKYELILCFEEATLVSPSAFDTSALKAVPAAGEGEIKLDGYETERALTRQMRDWLESLRDGRPVPTSGEEGREAVRLAEAAYRSAQTAEVQRL